VELAAVALKKHRRDMGNMTEIQVQIYCTFCHKKGMGNAYFARFAISFPRCTSFARVYPAAMGARRSMKKSDSDAPCEGLSTDAPKTLIC
jgi:hypothetical protein